MGALGRRAIATRAKRGKPSLADPAKQQATKPTPSRFASLSPSAFLHRLALAGESIIKADSGLELTRRIRALVRGSS